MLSEMGTLSTAPLPESGDFVVEPVAIQLLSGDHNVVDLQLNGRWKGDGV